MVSRDIMRSDSGWILALCKIDSTFIEHQIGLSESDPTRFADTLSDCLYDAKLRLSKNPKEAGCIP